MELVELPWSADYYLQTGVTIPPDGYAMLRDEYDAILLGALGDSRVPDNRHARDILLGTRFELDLYVNYRPVRLLDDRLCPLKERGRNDVNFVVFRENTYGASTVVKMEGQRVISTGPYALVRHPMYVGVLIMVIGMPLALGSYWGLLFLLLNTPFLMLRIVDEEAMLRRELEGYVDYTRHVRYRLVPGLW